MEISMFKSELKKVANQLKGKTIQLIQGNNSKPFSSLIEFGFAVLNEEATGRTLRVTRAWTSSGSVAISCFEQLTEMLKNETVTAVTFTSYHESRDLADYLRYDFGTND